MNANDLIDAYITDVAAQLPRKQRNDVAFELRALLLEQLQDQADAAGRSADAAMALELVRAFGRPADVAARYRPSLTIIDPADGHSFLRACVIGLGLIWLAGLLLCLRQPIHSGSDAISALGQWWVGTVIPSLWWPGLLVVNFGLASWARQRKPGTGQWHPRQAPGMHANRTAMALALVGMACGLFFLQEPRRVLDLVFGGHAAPAAYLALTYSDAFLQHQAPWLFVLVLLNLPLHASVMLAGRWSVLTRRLQLGLGLLTAAVMAWTVADGPALSTPSGDGMFKLILVALIALTLIDCGIKLLRRVRPAPGQVLHA